MIVKRDGTIVQDQIEEYRSFKTNQDTDLMSVCDHTRKKLHRLKNVLGVGYGLKTVNGRLTRDKSVNIFVSRKQPTVSLRIKDIVPKEVGAYPTDVVEVGDFYAEGVSHGVSAVGDRLKTYSGQFPLGVSGGCRTGVSAGTVGGLGQRSGKIYWVPNAHVATGDVRMDNSEYDRAFIQAGSYDGGGNVVGDRCYMTKLCVPNVPAARVDAALVAPVKEYLLSDVQLGLGKHEGTCRFELGDTLVKGGRTTGVTEGVVSTLGMSANVNYGGGRSQFFIGQIGASNMSEGGDSGSFYGLKKTKAVGGIGFAGSNTVTLLNPIQAVESVLGCQIITCLGDDGGPSDPPMPQGYDVDLTIAGLIPVKGKIRKMMVN